MKIIMLVENTTISNEYPKRHGLCIYIETANHKILFDLGPDNLFLQNAEKANINISDIDTVIISHGHSDHGGALKSFLAHNKKAIIYIHKDAFEPHYSKLAIFKFPVGLDVSLKNNSRIIFTDGVYCVDDGIQLFSGVKGKQFLPQSNQKLFEKKGKEYVLDNFCHEQHLLIKENNTSALFSGCSHNGIVNILREALMHTDTVDYTVAGFHLFNPISRRLEKTEMIMDVACELAKYSTKYYTFHCTGEKAFRILKNVLGKQIQYLSTGDSIEL